MYSSLTAAHCDFKATLSYRQTDRLIQILTKLIFKLGLFIKQSNCLGVEIQPYILPFKCFESEVCLCMYVCMYVCMHLYIYGIQEVFSAHQGSIYLFLKNVIIYICYFIIYIL